MWLHFGGKNIIIDPGPGSLVRIFERGLEPRDLDAVVLSHRHLDHVADVASVVESATDANKHKLELLLAPYDALEGEDPVVLKYTKKGFKRVEITTMGNTYILEEITIKPLIPHIHQGAETYSLEFSYKDKVFIYVPCGRFYEDMLYAYPENPDLMVFNTTFLKPNLNYYHLSAEDLERIIQKVKPKKTVLTHFSLQMLRAVPVKVAEDMKKRTGLEVVAATDGMKLEF
ncbi:MBL fold metallo-hydrolase [Sulfurihydrogenibium sp.]|uniref:MBL fold metallo-hydrolase n=1 Tax=Sulfurihydrogenibium sp. TaxID=2053621 RepID=UPI00260BCA15|nr:MBL fold metallo-hydrolase [Sulfurihydrogenibium sp.]